MKRKVMVEYDEAPAGVRAVYDAGMSMMGLSTVPNWMKAMGGNELVLRANWEKFRHVVLQGSVPPLLKQLILFVISIREGNRYCTSAHGYAVMGLDNTLSFDDLFSLAEGKAYATLPRSFQTAIDIVTRAALSPKELAEGEVDFAGQLSDAGFTEQEIDELMAQADFGVMMNTICSVLDIPPDKDFPCDRESVEAFS